MRLPILAFLILASPAVAAQSVVVVTGADSVAVDLAAMPSREAAVRVHDDPERTLAGPALADVLAAAGVRSDALRGPDLARVAVVESADGYRVAFSLAELSPGLGASPAFLAVRADGGPLGAGEGRSASLCPATRGPSGGRAASSGCAS